jgi:hypothetical protein
MTEQAQPTDAEIENAVKHLGAAMLSPVEVARAVLAKWGTPVGAGWLRDAVIEYRTASNALLLAQMETLGGRSVPIEPSWVEPFDAALRAQAKMYAALDATTPQPTQAQAGAVPLTVDEVEQLIGQWSYGLHGDRARYLVRMTEQHHGIKGADHG